MFSKDKLGELEFSGVNQSLSVDEDHNGQPLMPNKAAEFLYGPSGQDGALEIGPDGRGRVHDEVYGFWVDQGRGVVVSAVQATCSRSRTCGTGRFTRTTLESLSEHLDISATVGSRFRI